jgi:hypothetical protein
MFVRAPGYPAFVAAILWLTGSELTVGVVQAVTSLLTVVLVVLVARRLVGPTAGLVAGALVALDPLQFAAAGTLMTESVTSVLLAAILAARRGGVRPAEAQRRPPPGGLRARRASGRRHAGAPDVLVLPRWSLSSCWPSGSVVRRRALS